MESISGGVCRACRVRIANSTRSRTFTSSASRRAVPPESPHYVDIPSSFQPIQPYYPTPKGTLPLPREIFPANKPEKSSPQYIQDVTKEPRPENAVPASELSDMGRYKARMSNLRRTQLREALTSLYARKQSEISSMSRRSQAKQTQRSLLLSQAERDDARLTNVSTPKNMQPSSQTSLETLQAEVEVARRQHESKLANIAAQTGATQAMKMDALHTLYMNARNFITTEQQLDRMVREQFDMYVDDDGVASHAHFKNDSTGAGSSMWNFGPPQSISAKVSGRVNDRRAVTNLTHAITLQRFAQDKQKSKAQDASKHVKDQERFKRIAEKLSGGKI